jgi:gamma-glutamylcyclotransferase
MAIEYFAYASNMDPEVMAARCHTYRTIGPARLAGYELAFTRRSQRSGTGVADIVPAEQSEVWGVLYEITEACLESLDRKEGAGWAYERIEVPVLGTDGASHRAYTYVVLSKEPSPVLPSSEYVERLVSAARAQELPGQYVAKLQSLKDAVAVRDVSA